MSNQVIPYGSTVEISSDGGTTYSEIPEVKSFAVPADTKEYPEVTNLDSPNGRREFISGLVDGGEVAMTVGYTSAGYALIKPLSDAGTLCTIRVTLPLNPAQSTTGDIFVWTAFVTPSVQPADIGAAIDMEVQLRSSGSLTFTAGS